MTVFRPWKLAAFAKQRAAAMFNNTNPRKHTSNAEMPNAELTRTPDQRQTQGRGAIASLP